MNKLKKAVKKIINNHSDRFYSPREDLIKDIIEAIDCDTAEKTLQNKLRVAQKTQIRRLDKDSMLTYAEELNRLYFVLKDTVGKMDTALKWAEDHPAELTKDDVFEVRAFLKEADILIESEFEFFAKF